jgi:hypothetical protein
MVPQFLLLTVFAMPVVLAVVAIVGARAEHRSVFLGGQQPLDPPWSLDERTFNLFGLGGKVGSH